MGVALQVILLFCTFNSSLGNFKINLKKKVTKLLLHLSDFRIFILQFFILLRHD